MAADPKLEKVVTDLVMPLRYVIGADDGGSGVVGVATEVAWDCDVRPPKGEAVGYCNLLDERYGDGNRSYAPYLPQSGTSEDYDEGLIDPAGPGFDRNLRDQFKRRLDAGFKYVELDNPDSYSLATVLHANDLAAQYGLMVLAKNPGLGCTDADADAVLRQVNVVGIIVEAGAGTPNSMARMRNLNGRPTLPVWFVNFGRGARSKANRQHAQIGKLSNQWASWCSEGEYENAILL
jgi:hypothetical protein